MCNDFTALEQAALSKLVGGHSYDGCWSERPPWGKNGDRFYFRQTRVNELLLETECDSVDVQFDRHWNQGTLTLHPINDLPQSYDFDFDFVVSNFRKRDDTQQREELAKSANQECSVCPMRDHSYALKNACMTDDKGICQCCSTNGYYRCSLSGQPRCAIMGDDACKFCGITTEEQADRTQDSFFSSSSTAETTPSSSTL